MNDVYPMIRQEIENLLKTTKMHPILLAIDGYCASGKTTLSMRLREEFDANVIHMDDFYLQKHQRTSKRLEEVGGNVDYERFQLEVLQPLLAGKEIAIYSCVHPDFHLEFKETLRAKRINIVEGSYALHPYFGNPYHFRILLEEDYQTRVARIRHRNGEVMLQRFLEEWIPKENQYFEELKKRANAIDLVIQKGVVEFERYPSDL